MNKCIYKEFAVWKEGITIKAQYECRVADAKITKGFCNGCKCKEVTN